MIIKKSIVYLGIENPSSPAQVRLEIGGLKHAIKVAEERIASLEQSLAIVDLRKEEIALNGETQEAGTNPETNPKAQKTD